MRLNEFYESFVIERHEDVVAVLWKYMSSSDVDQYYFTFTELDKVGINPGYSHDTPLGVYAYPLRAMYSHLRNNDIPYAGRRRYLYLLKAKTKVTELSKITMEEYQRTFDKVYDLYADQLNLEKDALWNQIDKATEYFGFYKRTPYTLFWTLTRFIAKELVKTTGGKVSVAWNGILRKLGYKAFSDNEGLGVIHRNEPVQAVFLTSHAYQIVEKLHNTRKTWLDVSSIEIKSPFMIYEYLESRFGFFDDYTDMKVSRYDYETDVNYGRSFNRYKQWMVSECFELLETGKSNHFIIPNYEAFWEELVENSAGVNSSLRDIIALLLNSGYKDVMYNLLLFIRKHPEIADTGTIWWDIYDAVKKGKLGLSRKDIAMLFDDLVFKRIGTLFGKSALPDTTFYENLVKSIVKKIRMRRPKDVSLRAFINIIGDKNYQRLIKFVPEQKVEEIVYIYRMVV